jgi:hypothetical protein
MDTEARGKILSPVPGSNLDRPVIQPVANPILTELPGSVFTGSNNIIQLQIIIILTTDGGEVPRY